MENIMTDEELDSLLDSYMRATDEDAADEMLAQLMGEYTARGLLIRTTKG
jgi:hypothetical protein